MKTIQIEIPEGKKAEWVNGVMTLVDDKPKDITERIKTFDDAVEWCVENGKAELVADYLGINYNYAKTLSDDVFAYLKLRIITCALNEGWKPTFESDEIRYFSHFEVENNNAAHRTISSCGIGFTSDSGSHLVFKSRELAEYAATQFKDIYMGFCCKGKEQ